MNRGRRAPGAHAPSWSNNSAAGGAPPRGRRRGAHREAAPRREADRARAHRARCIDPGAPFLEIGLLIAYDRYDGQAPAAGVVTGLGRIEGRPAVIVANDATVKAGAWWPETITKILRAQEIAMRNRLPIVYLVDSAGVNLPLPGRHLSRAVRRGAHLSTTTR